VVYVIKPAQRTSSPPRGRAVWFTPPQGRGHALPATVGRVNDDPGWRDLGFARLDTDRVSRTGDPEVVYGVGKSPDQTVTLLQALRAAHPHHLALATRLEEPARAAVRAAFADEARVDDLGRCAAVGAMPAPQGRVAVVAAGTSDLPVAAEAAFTVQAFGADVTTIADVGVAGLHRLLAVRHELDDVDCLVVVAGMEGALPSVVGGLTGVPLVAVPTSVGYGTSFGGLTALLAMLNSCAPGVVVVNVDNGFGAGVHAARVARRAGGTKKNPP
jgi:pyridinium-3,5-biscarboxylic acid mononucleotide synthase